MREAIYAVEALDTCFALPGNFSAYIDKEAQTIFVPPKVFDVVCRKAATEEPTHLHLLSIVESFPSEIASCLGWTPKEALEAAGKLRAQMVAHGLAMPEALRSFSRGARDPQSSFPSPKLS